MERRKTRLICTHGRRGWRGCFLAERCRALGWGGSGAAAGRRGTPSSQRAHAELTPSPAPRTPVGLLHYPSSSLPAEPRQRCCPCLRVVPSPCQDVGPKVRGCPPLCLPGTRPHANVPKLAGPRAIVPACWQQCQFGSRCVTWGSMAPRGYLPGTDPAACAEILSGS